MSTVFYNKNSFSVGSFPIAFSIITFALQLTQVFLSASSSPRLTVARKASPSPSSHHSSFIPTPTVPCIPTRTLPSDYPDVPTAARPLLASLVLVMLGILVLAGSTYIRRKSGTIFTPLIPPSRKEQDPPQPPTPPNPPNPNEDDSAADDKDEGEENGDKDGDDGDDDEDEDDADEDEDEEDQDGDEEEDEDDEDKKNRDGDDDSASSEDDDGSEDSSNDDPEDPEDPSGDLDDEEPPSPPPNPNPWDILLLSILYLACIITLTRELFSTLLKRIINTLSHRLKTRINHITLSVGKIVDCALVWLDQSLLQLYDEMMWINNERPPRPVFDIGMRDLGPKCTPVVLRATDELHEIKQTLLVKIEKVSQVSSTWASKVCPFFRGNDNMQSSRFNDTTPNLTWSRAPPSYRPSRDDAAIPMPTNTSVDDLRIHESANTSAITTPLPVLSPFMLHVTSPEEWTREDEYCGNVHSSTTIDFIAHSINNAPAAVGIPHTHETPNVNNLDSPVTLPAPNEYFDEELEDLEVGEEEDDRVQEHYIQEEDWHEDIDVDQYHDFDEERECETSFTDPEEYESTEYQDHCVEQDVYEDEDIYGDEYPGFYDDGDEPGGTNEEECTNDQILEEDLEETIEESEPSHRYIGAPETSPEGLQPFSDVEGNANFAMPLGTSTESKATRRTTTGLFSGEDREAMTSQMVQSERVRQRCIEEQEARLEVAGDTAYLPDEEFRYTEEDSSEGQPAAPTLLTSITEERLVEMRALVEKAYSSHNYDPSQIDALTRWHLGLNEEENPCY
ncbi:hypothetical protein C0993_002224 [Termitomyces sp. T159_Od127]|nr:hypothetical protein C0993_002224 [Termitomyces sp. T159_Od127]